MRELSSFSRNVRWSRPITALVPMHGSPNAWFYHHFRRPAHPYNNVEPVSRLSITFGRPQTFISALDPYPGFPYF